MAARSTPAILFYIQTEITSDQAQYMDEFNYRAWHSSVDHAIQNYVGQKAIMGKINGW